MKNNGDCINCAEEANIQLKLTVDYNGDVCFQFRKYDKRDTLESRLIGAFVERAKKNGIRLDDGVSHLADDDTYHEYRVTANTKPR